MKSFKRYNKRRIETADLITELKLSCSICRRELSKSTLFDDVYSCIECKIDFKIEKIKAPKVRFKTIESKELELEFFTLIGDEK